jgi:hypothetical protein
LQLTNVLRRPARRILPIFSEMSDSYEKGQRFSISLAMAPTGIDSETQSGSHTMTSSGCTPPPSSQPPLICFTPSSSSVADTAYSFNDNMSDSWRPVTISLHDDEDLVASRLEAACDLAGHTLSPSRYGRILRKRLSAAKYGPQLRIYRRVAQP